RAGRGTPRRTGGTPAGPSRAGDPAGSPACRERAASRPAPSEHRHAPVDAGDLQVERERLVDGLATDRHPVACVATAAARPALPGVERTRGRRLDRSAQPRLDVRVGARDHRDVEGTWKPVQRFEEGAKPLGIVRAGVASGMAGCPWFRRHGAWSPRPSAASSGLKSPRRGRTGAVLRVGALSLCLLWGADPAAGARYGPGPHWIDRVGAGLAVFESSATVSADLDGDGVADLQFTATGPTKVVRRAASAAGDSAHRSHLDLEIYSMELTGEIPGLGPFRLVVGDGVPNLTRDGPLFSFGSSDEEPNPRLSHDRFHLLFEVDVLGLVLHNEAPLEVEAIIDRLPPIGAGFHQSRPPVPVVTSTGATILRTTEVVN